MSLRSPSYICVTLALLLASLVLVGCPKRPEVGQAGPGALGPAAAAAPSQLPAPVGTPTPDIPVVRVIPPAVAPVAPVEPTPASAPAPATAPAPSTQNAGPTVAPSAAGPAAAGTQSAGTAAPLSDVFFDFDKSNVRSDQQAAVRELVARLKQHRQAKVTVEGYCDERGSSEYNLALGERRAKAVKDALIKAGVAADRIATVSYGEERIFVPGKDESAWKWNRRAHFVISGP